MNSTEALIERGRAKRRRMERNKSRRKKAPEYPVSEIPEPLIPTYFENPSRAAVLTTADGCVQLVVHKSNGFSRYPFASIMAFPPTKLCSLCGIETGLLYTTPIGVVCDWLADNGHYDSPVHRLLMFARDNPVPFEDDTSGPTQ